MNSHGPVLYDDRIKRYINIFAYEVLTNQEHQINRIKYYEFTNCTSLKKVKSIENDEYARLKKHSLCIKDYSKLKIKGGDFTYDTGRNSIEKIYVGMSKC